MKIVTTLILFVTMLICTAAYADMDKPGMYAELNGAEIYGDGPQALGGEVGIVGYFDDNLSGRIGMAFLASDALENYFVGISSGLRLSAGDKIQPFIGAGAFLGESRKEVTVNGVTTIEVDDLILSTYPEIGFNIWPSNDIRITISGKWHFTSKGEDFPVYGIGVAIFY